MLVCFESDIEEGNQYLNCLIVVDTTCNKISTMYCSGGNMYDKDIP